MELTNKQWHLVKNIVASQNKSKSNRGRPSLDKREVMNAILWVLSKGARWKQIPDCYPQYQTCRNYFYEWLKSGAMENTLKTLLSDLDEEIDEEDEDLEQLTLHLEQNPPVSKKEFSTIIRKIDKKYRVSYPSSSSNHPLITNPATSHLQNLPLISAGN